MSGPLLTVRIVNMIPTSYCASVAGIEGGAVEWHVRNPSLFADAVELQMDMLDKKWAKLTQGMMRLDATYVISDDPVQAIRLGRRGYEIAGPSPARLVGAEHWQQRYPLFFWLYFSKEMYAKLDIKRRSKVHSVGDGRRISWFTSTPGIKVPVAGFRHGVCPAFRRSLAEALRWSGTDSSLLPPVDDETDSRFRSSHFAQLLLPAVLGELCQIWQE